MARGAPRVRAVLVFFALLALLILFRWTWYQSTSDGTVCDDTGPGWASACAAPEEALAVAP